MIIVEQPDYHIRINVKDNKVLGVAWKGTDWGMPYEKINKRRVMRLLREAVKHIEKVDTF